MLILEKQSANFIIFRKVVSQFSHSTRNLQNVLVCAMQICDTTLAEKINKVRILMVINTLALLDRSMIISAIVSDHIIITIYYRSGNR